MYDVIPGKVEVGHIVGIITPFLPYSHAEFALVMNSHDIIPVRMDAQQQEYIHKNYHIGKKVAIGFFNNQWHLGIPEHHASEDIQDMEKPADDLADEEVRYLQMVEQNFKNNVDNILERYRLTHLKVTGKATR